MIGGVKSHLESSPIPDRDARRARTNLVCTRTQRPHRDWARTVFFRGRGSGCSRPRYGISPLGGGHHQPRHRATRTYIGLGNRLWNGTDKTLCAPGPRRKQQWPHTGLTRTCPGVSRSLWQRPGLVVACCRAGSLSAPVLAWHLLKEVSIIFITSTMIWPQVKQQGGNTALPINRKMY